MLWGRYAQQKESLIDTNKHFVLKAAHPSPFSAYNGFFGCKHFSQANVILAKEGKQSINWQIS
jgi:uracil-DNA glycosylase